MWNSEGRIIQCFSVVFRWKNKPKGHKCLFVFCHITDKKRDIKAEAEPVWTWV